MYLFAGLGNPGKKHTHNRHNAGFQFLDYMVKKFGVLHTEFKESRKLRSKLAEIEMGAAKVLLCKPDYFMNKSGESVARVVNFYKTRIDELYVIHDDLDLVLGHFKIQRGKGPRLHNGVASIEEALGVTDFWRIRIGVDNRKPDNRIPGDAYVLQDFKESEVKKLYAVFKQIQPRGLKVLL